MTWILTTGPRLVARGRLAAVLDIAVERGLAQRERYPARRTGDDVERVTLEPGVRVMILAEAARWS